MITKNRLSPRILQLVFGVLSLAAGALIALRQDAPHALFQTAGTVGYALAAMLSFGSWVALGQPALAARVRRTLIVFHLSFIPMQFLFLLAHQMPWLGMALSTVIVVVLKPRFPRLRRMPRKMWLTLHVGISVGWLGLSLAMLTLAIVGATADSHVIRHGSYVIMHMFDLAIVIPSVFLAIITGVVVSLGTPWGLIKHWWVLTKFVIALSLPIIATVESGWIQELEARTENPAADPAGTGLLLVLCMALFVTLLWTAVILSVFKPGGRTRWGRRTEQRRRNRDTAGHSVADGAVAADLA